MSVELGPRPPETPPSGGPIIPPEGEEKGKNASEVGDVTLKSLGSSLQKAFFYVVKFKWVDDAVKLVKNFNKTEEKVDSKAKEQFAQMNPVSPNATTSDNIHGPNETGKEGKWVEFTDDIETDADSAARNKKELEVGTLLREGNKLKFEVQNQRIYAIDTNGKSHPIQDYVEAIGAETINNWPLQKNGLARYLDFKANHDNELRAPVRAVKAQSSTNEAPAPKSWDLKLEPQPKNQAEARTLLNKILTTHFSSVSFLVDKEGAEPRILAFVQGKAYDISNILKTSGGLPGNQNYPFPPNLDKETLAKLNDARLQAR